MLIITVGEAETIDKAVKKYKRKFDATKTMRNLRSRQHFTKPSVLRREEIRKAKYRQYTKSKESI